MEQIKIAPLVAAINQVMAEVSRVKKTGVNTHHRYRYASEEDLLEAIRPAMVRAGLVMMPGDVRILNQSDTGKNTLIYIGVDYDLHHTSGTGMKLTVASSGIDNQDKAIPKAMTMALKYAIIQLFLIPRSDNDPDEHKPERPEWSCNQAQFLAFARKHGGEDQIYRMCLEQGWPQPPTWDQARLENFMVAVNNGDLIIGGGNVDL